MGNSTLVAKLVCIRKEIESALNESSAKYPGVGAYLDMVRLNIELALTNLGVHPADDQEVFT